MNDIEIQSAITANLHTVRHRITQACLGAGRRPQDVRLLLATKTVSADRIRMAILAGEKLSGENKMQELKQKWEALQDLNSERHFIGHLQSNKVKEIVNYTTCIQSIDRMSIAAALHKKLVADNRSMDIMVQVNTSFEDSKFGLHPDTVIPFIEQVKQLPTLHITGLMTIGLFDADPEKVRPSYTLLRNIRSEIITKSMLDPHIFKHLSMGMSGDLETAIEEGATIIRVGTAIFGKRTHPDSYYWNEQQ